MVRDRSAETRGSTGLTRPILHVDDDPATRSAVREILSIHHEVISARGLSEALDFVRERRFGLYLLGGMFRDGSSLELCYELRLSDPKVPVLFLSLLPKDLRQQLLLAGATEILDKTGSAEALTDAVRRHVDALSVSPRRQIASMAG